MKKVFVLSAKIFSLISVCLSFMLFLAACGGGGGGAAGASIPASEYTTHNPGGYTGGGSSGGTNSGSSNGTISGSTPLNVISYIYNGQTYTSVEALKNAIAENAQEGQFTIPFTCTTAGGGTENRTARITKTVNGNNTEILIEHQYKATINVSGGSPVELTYYKNDGISSSTIANALGLSDDTVGDVTFPIQSIVIDGTAYPPGSAITTNGDISFTSVSANYAKWGISSTGQIEFSSALTSGETVVINAQNIHTINIPTDRQVNLNLSDATFQNNKVPSDFIPNTPSQKNNLTGIVLPNGITEISDNAFSLCENLTSVNIPRTVQTLGWAAFDACSSLSSVTFEQPSSLTEIGEAAFYHTALSGSITLPQGVETIGDQAFYWCDSLTSVTIPNTVETIGMNAFEKCSNMITLDIPANSQLQTIGQSAFKGTGLSSVTLPASVTTVAQSAFTNCNSLTSVTINGSPTLGKEAFKNATTGSVIEVTFNGMPFLESTGTSNSPFGSDFKAILKSGAPSAIEYASSLKDIVFDFNGNVDNMGYTSGFSNWTNLERLEARSGIANIADRAFENFHNLETVIIQNGIIRSEAFKGCDGLSTLTLGEGVTQLSNSAFNGCINLQEVELPASAVNIQNTVFEGCGNLTVTMKTFPTNAGTGRFSGITGDFTLIFKPVNAQMEIKSIMDNLTSVTGLGNFFGSSSGYPGGNLRIVFDRSDGGTFKINGGTFSSSYFPSTAVFEFIENPPSTGFIFDSGSCFKNSASGVVTSNGNPVSNLTWDSGTVSWQ